MFEVLSVVEVLVIGRDGLERCGVKIGGRPEPVAGMAGTADASGGGGSRDGHAFEPEEIEPSLKAYQPRAPHYHIPIQ
jgi:hypothetical protein